MNGFSGWTIYDYVKDGKSVIETWLESLPPGIREEVKAQLNAKLISMRALRLWPEKLCKAYKGEDGLWEVRIPWNKVQYRPLGCLYGLEHFGFTLLAGATERNNKIPGGDIQRAVTRMNALDKEKIREHRYD